MTRQRLILKTGRENVMIPDDEPFVYATPRKPAKQNPELEKQLDAMGFRPFTEEW